VQRLVRRCLLLALKIYGFGHSRKQPLDRFGRVALEPVRLAVNRVNDSASDLDDRTQSARVQDLGRTSTDGLPHRGNRVGVSIRRIDVLDFDSHFTGDDLNVRLVDRNVVATAGRLADLANVKIQSAPPPQPTHSFGLPCYPSAPDSTSCHNPRSSTFRTEPSFATM
jgi:hypothetical protein